MSKPSFFWSEHDSRLAPITLKAIAPADDLILSRDPPCKLAMSTHVGSDLFGIFTFETVNVPLVFVRFFFAHVQGYESVL